MRRAKHTGYLKRLLLAALLLAIGFVWNLVRGEQFDGGGGGYGGTSESVSGAAQSDLTVGSGWAELPVMDTCRRGVVYATHYVSSDGMKIAAPGSSGRVRNYTVAFDTGRRQPLWVAAPMHRWYRSPRGTGRTDWWAYDPVVAIDVQPDLARSYRQVDGEGNYSRGHLVASADRLRGWALNAQTFYYTNIAPQLHEGFNGGVWNELEQRVQRWGDQTPDTLYVVTGSAFIGESRVTSDRDGERIPVPSHFYKVLLSSKRPTGCAIGGLAAEDLRAVGFWLEHAPTGERLSRVHMRSVAEIERLVGEEFFPMLAPEARCVKDSFDAKDWGMR